MPLEIERKFLVKGAYKQYAKKATKITQGYLSSVPERTVRVRIIDSKGFITIKGKSNASGTTRFEWEKEILFSEANELLELCEPGVIDKTRFLIDSGKHTFEVDEFYGDNEGLTLAEVELSDENEDFIKPEWLGEEVTGKLQYFNAKLTKNPFKNW